MPTSLANTNLFKSIKVGDYELQNRVVHAPTTRVRVSEDFVPLDSMLKYYEERAENECGLLITESVMVSPRWGIMGCWPMISTDSQLKAWGKIVQAVHNKKSRISCQLFGVGRAAVPELLKQKGLQFVGASAIYQDEESQNIAEKLGIPLRALTVSEIHQVTKDFVVAAKNCILVDKFDYVEIHAANMYLLNQFIDEESNHRTDQYGGSIENRSRLVLEVIDAVMEAIGPQHTAIRLSPYSRFQGSKGIDSKTDPIATYGYILSELERRAKHGKRLAYVSFVEPNIFGAEAIEEAYVPDSSWVNEIWKGIIIRTGNLIHDEKYKLLKKYVDGDDRTLIGASRYYSSNPDLATRLKNGYALTKYDRSSFYKLMSNQGYLTWGNYGEDNHKYASEISRTIPKPLA
ncbi:hypothetical protein FOA43_001297 [Brettanomyces nanus]|uniref:NADH:flavin oxidoreductase/NADH oxidase N-terminal domain-containing protein n=1 Tax=Eeniella nana TaxID=13502 RepID=A0A875RX42_EENNA|nr:uncharacterized protein FOA43_001297 [Brettanomyces nanus]QPG73981.1 hypothetical protein FOA43_001297 [Brettanomyces nanus]